MLCSIRGEPKPGSNWLDRLRSSKGFPTGDHLDLDNFLSDSPVSNPSNSESTQSPQLPPLPEISSQNEGTENENGDELFSIVTNVLSELFNFGNPNGKPKLSGKKIPRKQANPRFCVVQNNVEESVHKDESTPEVRVNYEERRKEGNVDVGGEEEEEEMVGYSRSEVTVIDTSWGEWKAEKVVYRRRNVWKVREKKGKWGSCGRKKKKRKESEGSGNGKKKKARVLGLEEVEVGSAGDGVVPLKLNEGQNSQNDKRGEVCTETLDDASQIPKKRFALSTSPRKSGKGGSSVILIEGIPTSKKSGAKLPKNNFKDTQRQCKAS